MILYFIVAKYTMLFTYPKLLDAAVYGDPKSEESGSTKGNHLYDLPDAFENTLLSLSDKVFHCTGSSCFPGRFCGAKSGHLTG